MWMIGSSLALWRHAETNRWDVFSSASSRAFKRRAGYGRMGEARPSRGCQRRCRAHLCCGSASVIFPLAVFPARDYLVPPARCSLNHGTRRVPTQVAWRCNSEHFEASGAEIMRATRLWMLGAVASWGQAALARTIAFTYQGSYGDGTAPANGHHDRSF